MENPVIIFGAGGLGKAALEIFSANNVLVFGFLDDNEKLHNTEIQDITILGSTDDDSFLKYIGKKCEAFVAEEDPTARKQIVEMLVERRKVMPVNAIHRTAIISESAIVTHGIFANAGVIIGNHAKIGSHCIIHSRATIEHGAILEDYVQVGAGSIIGAGVTLQAKAFIGTGATLVAGVKIGKNAKVGPGSVVVTDVPAGATFFGNPAKKID